MSVRLGTRSRWVPVVPCVFGTPLQKQLAWITLVPYFITEQIQANFQRAPSWDSLLRVVKLCAQTIVFHGSILDIRFTFVLITMFYLLRYVACSGIDASSCFNQSACELRPVECTSPGECSAAGSCSDESILVGIFKSQNLCTAISLMQVNRYWGEKVWCLSTRQRPSGRYLFQIQALTLMLTTFGTAAATNCDIITTLTSLFQYTIPNGCVDVSITTAEECEALGFTWLEPANNASICTQEQGCYEYYPELGIVGYQYPYAF